MEQDTRIGRNLFIKTELVNCGLLDVLSDVIISYDYEFGGECVKYLKGHTDIVTCMALLNDHRLMTGSCDKTIKIWNLKTGKCEHTLQGHHSVVNHLVVLSNDCFASVEGLGKEIWIWCLLLDLSLENVKTYKCAHILRDHTGPISCLELVNNKLISGSWDKTAIVWDSVTYTNQHILIGHTNAMIKVKKLSETQIITSDGILRIWDINTFECIYVSKILEDPIRDIIVNDHKIIGIGKTTIRIWDINNGIIMWNNVDLWDINTFFKDEDSTNTTIFIHKHIINPIEIWHAFIIDKNQIAIYLHQGLNGILKIWDVNTKEYKMTVDYCISHRFLILPDQRLLTTSIPSFTMIDPRNRSYEGDFYGSDLLPNQVSEMLLLPNDQIAMIFEDHCHDIMIWK